MKASKHFLAALTIGCLLSAPAAFASCGLPSAPSKIPDGSTASMQAMVSAMQTVKEYNHDVETYLKCLDFEARQNQLSSESVLSLHNAAVERLQRVTAKFNKQVRIFKSKHS
jgi:predicted transglutaminase-like cysteine proteinase